MKFKVILGYNQVHGFEKYSEALEFSRETGGILYEQVIY